MNVFGRRAPSDFEHVSKYPLRMLLDDPLSALAVPPAGVERSLGLPRYWKTWDQGKEGACVGFGSSAMMGITNTKQLQLATGTRASVRFAPQWLYHEAQLVDEWPQTPPAQGTSVRASCDVLRTVGHRLVKYGKTYPPDLGWGIAANRWAQTYDEIRAAIYAGLAVSFGINWYANFSKPVSWDGELWIGRGSLGRIVGGHCVCLFRMSDRRQAFRLMNSWGEDYPPVWIEYDLVQRLLSEDGEGAVIVDR